MLSQKKEEATEGSRRTTDNRSIHFDGSVNLGHILTFLGFMITCGVMWSTMDKRVTVLEDARLSQRDVNVRHESEVAEFKRASREDMKIISDKLDRLIERK
jgi:hypothetical protein